MLLFSSNDVYSCLHDIAHLVASLTFFADCVHYYKLPLAEHFVFPKYSSG